MSAGTGLVAAITPLIAACAGAIYLFVKRTSLYRNASSRSNRHLADIEQILLEAKIREAKAREAAAAEEREAS
jgi:hypothetical protein